MPESEEAADGKTEDPCCAPWDRPDQQGRHPQHGKEQTWIEGFDERIITFVNPPAEEEALRIACRIAEKPRQDDLDKARRRHGPKGCRLRRERLALRAC